MKALDPEDPFALVGVQIPCESEESLRDMALCFAEEFLRDGWQPEKVLALFRNPFYRGPYMIWQTKGEAFVKDLVEQAARIWGAPQGEEPHPPLPAEQGGNSS